MIIKTKIKEENEYFILYLIKTCFNALFGILLYNIQQCVCDNNRKKTLPFLNIDCFHNSCRNDKILMHFLLTFCTYFSNFGWQLQMCTSSEQCKYL